MSELEYDEDGEPVFEAYPPPDPIPMHSVAANLHIESLDKRLSKLERRVTMVTIGTAVGFVGVLGMVGKLVQQFGVVMQQLNQSNAQAQQLVKTLKQRQQPAPAPAQSTPSGPVYDPGPQELSEDQRSMLKDVEVNLHDEPEA